jgi:GNAT superfamily N-acetyltransferase
VLAPALRCASLIRELLPWKRDSVAAMVCGDLRAVPSLALDPGLTVQQVERVVDDPPGGVPLVRAATLALAAAPDIELSQAQFVAFLRALPTAFRLFAAVDSAGDVRATSGVGVFGAYAQVIFVDTDPNWRNRGIGTAMTAYALNAAHRAGAHHASLDASSASRSIYLRLGFEEAGRVTRFHQNP